jgi:hypothetical protein
MAARMCIWSLPAGVVASMPLRQRHEGDAERLKFLEEDDEVLQIAPEAVQSPDD